MKNKHVNAIVIGAGAGGGAVAKELSFAGLSVVLFERGGWAKYDDVYDDELHSQRIRALGQAYGPDDARHCRVIENKDGSTKIIRPSDGGFSEVAACVGSGTVSYGAMAWRFMEEDFKLKSIYGAVEGSSLSDWPISYSDLEPCYEKAEWEMGVSGDETQNPFSPPRNKPLPMPPFSHNKEALILKDAALRLGWHPFPIPMLRNSVPYDNRPACYRMRTCVGFACPVNAKAGSHNTVIPKAIETGNCELRINSLVSEILVNDNGKIYGVNYFDADNKQQTQSADVLIVSASAIETARLLLNSKSKFFPNGIGNGNDWVGRNLQGHLYTGAYGIFKDEIYDDFGPGASIALCDFNHHNEGIVGGALLANEFIRMPYQFSEIRPKGEPYWGLKHKEFQRNNFKKVARVMGPLQEMPNFNSRVTVDPSVKDFWGIPVARLSGERLDADMKGANFIAEKAEKWLLEAGAEFTWQTASKGKGVSGGAHQAGTCRMGNDPKKSVTDPFGRVHETPNLFVADGGLNVTNGGFNPALTIIALGYRVGGYIANEWAKGNRFK